MTIWDALRTFRGSSATLWVPQEGLASPPSPIADGPDVVQLLASDSAGGTVKATSAYWQAVMADSPIVYMPLANGPVDVSGHGYDGVATDVTWTPTPSVALPSGFIGAAQVTGNGYVELPTTLNVSGGFTVEIWASTVSTSGISALVGSRGSDSNPDTFDFKFDGSNTATGLHSDIGTGAAWLTTSANFALAYSANTVYYLLETVTPSGWALWVDAVQVSSGSYAPGTPVLANSSNPLFVGSDGPGSGDPDANGLLMQFAVYSGSLSSARVSAHYSAAFES